MKAIPAFFVLVLLCSCQNPEEGSTNGQILNLPLTFEEGFEPGGFSYAPLSEEYGKDDS